VSATPIDRERLRALLAAHGPFDRNTVDGINSDHGEDSFARIGAICELIEALPALLDEVEAQRALIACLRAFARDVVWLDACDGGHAEFGAAARDRITRLLTEDIPALPGDVTLATKAAATPDPEGAE
jgi:hypothetical protein